MRCLNCQKENTENVNFCIGCGSELVREYDIAKDRGKMEVIGSAAPLSNNKSIYSEGGRLKKIIKGVGFGGLVAGGGVLYLLVFLLRFVFVAIVGLYFIWLSLLLFSNGSIILGLLVLLIGTPLAIGIASYLFFFLFILTILALVIWGISHLLGHNSSFNSSWDIVWLVVKIIVEGIFGFTLVISFIEAFKQRDIKSFFKKSWLYILIFIILGWIFF